MRFQLIVAASLILICPQLSLAEDQKQPSGKKPVSLALGSFDSLSVSCNWGNHCRDDLGPVETAYMKYLDEGAQSVKNAVQANASAEQIQQKVSEYRAGLQAREALYGNCPGRCLSYDFPVDLRNSAKVVARSSRLDLLIDVPAIYYGADLVLKNPDQTDKIKEELHRQTARYR